MKVLLLENVQGLGKKGDVVEVKDGYGKNFLIAKGKAQNATNEVINKFKAKQRQEAELSALALAELKQLKVTLESTSITISRKVGANNMLFGAITKEDIATALATKRIELDKKLIDIPKPIKQVGQFEVAIKLGQGINASLKVEVKAEA